MKVKIKFDASFNENTKKAKIAVVMFKNNLIYNHYREIEGVDNSTEAELCAASWALSKALETDWLDCSSITLYGDCKHIINFINEATRLRHVSEDMKQSIKIKLKTLRKLGMQVNINWVPREQNKNADKLTRRKDFSIVENLKMFDITEKFDLVSY